MLSKSLAALPLFSLVHAGLTVTDLSECSENSGDMACQLEAGMKEANRENMTPDNPCYDDEDAPTCKSFGSSWAQILIESINGYGCWCYFQDAHGQGRGPPTNEVDAQCKILHDGYTCILMDAEDEGEECTPWDVEYNSATGLGILANQPDNDSLENALRIRCNQANRKLNKRGNPTSAVNNCAARACMVENYFVVEVMRLFLTGVTFDPSPLHSKGVFDPRSDCPIKEGVKSDKECCGFYPLRFPYKHLNGDRGCCVSRTYNAVAMECCADGSVKVSC